jgi:DNA-binding helix-hairpin-helix protein with protein kinase domain
MGNKSSKVSEEYISKELERRVHEIDMHKKFCKRKIKEVVKKNYKEGSGQFKNKETGEPADKETVERLLNKRVDEICEKELKKLSEELQRFRKKHKILDKK